MGKFGLYTGVVNGDEFVKIPYLFQFQKLVIYKFTNIIKIIFLLIKIFNGKITKNKNLKAIMISKFK